MVWMLRMYIVQTYNECGKGSAKDDSSVKEHIRKLISVVFRNITRET